MEIVINTVEGRHLWELYGGNKHNESDIPLATIVAVSIEFQLLETIVIIPDVLVTHLITKLY